MNLLYSLPWHDPGAEDNARRFYHQLRTATAVGTRFPFDCPYEVALAHQRSGSGSDRGEWMVAILAMRGIILGDTERAETASKLEEWFTRCGEPGMRGGIIHPADHLKISSELGLDYEIIENFGTFVGEPDPESVKKETAPETDEPVVQTVPELPKERPHAVEVARLEHVTPPPVVKPAVTPSTTQSGNACLGWLGGGLIGIGGLVGVLGVLTALLLLIGVYADETGTTSISDLMIMMACFPLPMLIVGAVMAGIGIFVVIQLRKKRAIGRSIIQ